MILAQSTDLPSVPDSTLKWVLIILVSIVLIAAALYAAFHKSGPVKIDDNPPPEYRKAPKRYNHELAEQRNADMNGRLTAHDAELDSIWNTMRSEDQKIRNELEVTRQVNGDRFNRICFALGKIAEKLGVDIDPA
jgi:hypothetical protein